MTFPRYSAYKDSGVTWLGEVPGHWEVKRLKQICHVFPSNVDKKSYDGETAVRLCNYTDVYYNERIVDSMELMAATATTEQIEKFTLKAGDTIITKDSETADDIAIAAYVPEDLPGVICGYHLSMVRPKHQTCGLFVKRLFDSTYVKSKFEVLANGLTRVGLGTYALDNVEMPVPPEAEQTAIANFLDRETAKIDDLIAEQRNLTALLKEKRQAVISHAVTKGLNAKAVMKDSGVVWLGEVPGHWEVKPLKSVASHNDETLDDSTSPDFEILYVDISSVDPVAGITAKDAMPFSAAPSRARRKVRDGDAIVSTVRTYLRAIARITKPEENLVVSTGFVVVRPSKQVFHGFLGHLLTTNFFVDEVISRSVGVSYPAINASDLMRISVPIPVFNEQQTIAAFLDHQTTQIDTLITETEKTIALLQERRSALISAAVTGKMDVRAAA